MKKFTKMFALGLAAALVFGMTVSAAGSVDTSAAEPGAVNTVIQENSLKDKDGNVVENVKVEAAQLSTDVYSETFGLNYSQALNYVLSNKNPEVWEAFRKARPASSSNAWNTTNQKIVNISLVSGDIPEGGLYVPVEKAVEGAGYVVAHWNGTKWEVLPVDVKDGVVYALFTNGFSPVYIGIYTAAETVEPDPTTPPSDPSNSTTSSTPSTPESPKTGETVPVAGILAVICFAGVAVCAKKARYNR